MADTYLTNLLQGKPRHPEQGGITGVIGYSYGGKAIYRDNFKEVERRNYRRSCTELKEYFRTHDMSTIVNERLGNGCTLLEWAILNKHKVGVDLLLEAGANAGAMDAKGSTVMHMTRHMSASTVKKLIKHGGARVMSVPNEDGVTPIMLAAREGRRDILEVLLPHVLPHRDDLNIADKKGRSAFLTWDGTIVCPDICEMLLEAGANPMHVPASGKPACMVALESYDWRATQVMVRYAKRQNIDTRDSEGKTCLHKALELGDIHTAKYLVEAGADMRCVDKDGNTAAHYAARSGTASCVSYVLDKMGYDAFKHANDAGELPEVRMGRYGDDVRSLFTAVEAVSSYIKEGGDPERVRICEQLARGGYSAVESSTRLFDWLQEDNDMAKHLQTLVYSHGGVPSGAVDRKTDIGSLTSASPIVGGFMAGMPDTGEKDPFTRIPQADIRHICAFLGDFTAIADHIESAKQWNREANDVFGEELEHIKGGDQRSWIASTQGRIVEPSR